MNPTCIKSRGCPFKSLYVMNENDITINDKWTIKMLRYNTLEKQMTYKYLLNDKKIKHYIKNAICQQLNSKPTDEGVNSEWFAIQKEGEQYPNIRRAISWRRAKTLAQRIYRCKGLWILKDELPQRAEQRKNRITRYA